MKGTVKGLTLFILILLFSSGCAMVSMNGMLEYDPSKKDSKIDDVKFSLIVIKNNQPLNMTEKAKEKYPHIFSNEFTSLPVWLELNCKHERVDHSDTGPLIFALSLTLIPGPEHDENDSCSGYARLYGMDEYLINKPVNYYFNKSWVVPGPLHWLFVPLVHSRKQFEPLQEQTLVEYAFRSISEVETSKLKEAYNYRKARMQKIAIYGEPYWVFVGLEQSEKAKKEGKEKHDIASVLFWKDYPQPLAKPMEGVVIAIKENDQWKPVMSIPRRMGLKKLTMVSAKIQDGRPLGVEVKEDVRPKIEYFLYLSNPNDPEEIRWSNNMLVDAKNLTFSDDLKQKDRDSLIKMQTELEKELLRLNENLSKLELSLQQKLVKNEDVRAENELIPLYQQRLSIFEALITSLKQTLKFK